jgi:hypothetical protein
VGLEGAYRQVLAALVEGRAPTPGLSTAVVSAWRIEEGDERRAGCYRMSCVCHVSHNPPRTCFCRQPFQSKHAGVPIPPLPLPEKGRRGIKGLRRRRGNGTMTLAVVKLGAEESAPRAPPPCISPPNFLGEEPPPFPPLFGRWMGAVWLCSCMGGLGCHYFTLLFVVQPDHLCVLRFDFHSAPLSIIRPPTEEALF